MADPDNGGEKTDEAKKEIKKEPRKSERTENVVAITVFVVMGIIIVGLFTNGFGLFSSEPPQDRVTVPIGDSPVRGAAQAPVTIVAFSDFECPFCKNAEATVTAVREQYGDRVRYVFKNFPLTSIHPNSYNAALASECANEQGKFWEYHDRLFNNNQALDSVSLKRYGVELGLNPEQFDACLDGRKYAFKVDADQQLGRQLGVTGTPTFFINGAMLVGAQPVSEFEQIIEQDLQR